MAKEIEKICICIPTYNEVENIELLLESLNKVSKTINKQLVVLIIDDNSPDKTANIAKATIGKLDNIDCEVIIRESKQGLAKAYLTGFKYALSRGDISSIITMDADLSHNPKDIPKLMEYSDDYDLVIGSRYVEGGSTPDWSLRRRLISSFGNFYARSILRCNVHDLTGGFNLYTSKSLRSINLEDVSSDGYSFQIEMKYNILKNKGFLKEVPIVFKDRNAGDSKLDKSIILEAIAKPWILRKIYL